MAKPKSNNNNSKKKKEKSTKESNKKQIDEENCGICLEKPEDPGKPNNCKHVFCYTCIDQWSKTANVCPICSKDFTKIEKLDSDGDIQSKHTVERVDNRLKNYITSNFVDDDDDDDDDGYYDDDSDEENEFLSNLHRALLMNAMGLIHGHNGDECECHHHHLDDLSDYYNDDDDDGDDESEENDDDEDEDDSDQETKTRGTSDSLFSSAMLRTLFHEHALKRISEANKSDSDDDDDDDDDEDDDDSDDDDDDDDGAYDPSDSDLTNYYMNLSDREAIMDKYDYDSDIEYSDTSKEEYDCIHPNYESYHESEEINDDDDSDDDDEDKKVTYIHFCLKRASLLERYFSKIEVGTEFQCPHHYDEDPDI